MVRKLQDMLNDLRLENSELKKIINVQEDKIRELTEELSNLKNTVIKNNENLATQNSTDILIDSERKNTNPSLKNKGSFQDASHKKKNRKLLEGGMDQAFTNNAENHRNKINKTKLAVFCIGELALIISFCIPQKFYPNVQMIQENTVTIKAVILLLSMIVLYKMISALPIKHSMRAMPNFTKINAKLQTHTLSE